MSFSLDAFLAEHNEIQTVGIAGHVSPDGDCIGSCTALYLYLKKNYPSYRVDIFMESVPEELRILKGAEEIRTDFVSDVERYDVFFILDTIKERTNDAEKIYDKARLRVNFDHHVSNKGSGDICFIEPNASSTCEVLCMALDYDKMDKDIATNLYAGIVTDTGMFHYSSTSPATMRAAAKLMEYGFDHSDLIERVELEKRFSQNRALGVMLAKAKLELNGKVITSFCSAQEMKESGFTSEDFDGVVSQMNLTTGVECALFAHGTKESTVRMNLRSKGGVNVSEIAVSVGGGGHVRASGCTLSNMTCEEALALMIDKIKEQLANK